MSDFEDLKLVEELDIKIDINEITDKVKNIRKEFSGIKDKIAENDIFTKNEEGKVLVMDNPFAQTNASHLLKPLMDIAKKNNTQLICLTGLGGESIYNRFDNIYVLNLKGSSVQRGIQNLKVDHIQGEELEGEIIPSRFKIEEQTRLF